MQGRPLHILEHEPGRKVSYYENNCLVINLSVCRGVRSACVCGGVKFQVSELQPV